MTRFLLNSAPAPRSRSPRVRAVLLSALVAIGMCAGLVSAPAPAGASTTLPTTLENTIAFAVKALINTERAVNGLAPVHMSSHLRLSARRHNLTMARYDEMSHQLPGEAWFGRRFQYAGYYWNWAGENIGWNSDTTQSGVLLLERMMYNEKAPDDGHRLNILNRHYYNVGVDVYIDKTHHKVWLTTDFGHRT